MSYYKIKAPNGVSDSKMSLSLQDTKETKLAPPSSSFKARGKVHNRSNGPGLSLPPGIEATPIVGHKFRFQVLSDITSAALTVGNMIGICGVIGTVTNTTAVSVASCVKLRRVTIWPALDTSTNHSPEISYATNYGTTSDRSWSRTVPLGVTVTGSVKSKPGKDTLAALWQNSGATSSTLCTLYDIQKGSIVDVDVTFCMRNSQNGVSYSVTTAVIGTMYYLYMDGSGGKLQPVALPNTF